MLILTRKVGEKIMIADNITITVMGISNTAVSIGVQAPIDISVDREEIYARKQLGKGGLPGEGSSNEDDEDERAMRALARIERNGRISYNFTTSRGTVTK